jgi:hypothetical protein
MRPHEGCGITADETDGPQRRIRLARSIIVPGPAVGYCFAHSRIAIVPARGS